MTETTKAGSGQYEQINTDIIKSVHSDKDLRLLGFYCYLKTFEVWTDNFTWTIPNGPTVTLNKGDLRLTANKVRKDLKMNLNTVKSLFTEMEQAGFIKKHKSVKSSSGKKTYELYKMYPSYKLQNVPTVQNNVPTVQNNVPRVPTNYTISDQTILDKNNQLTEALPGPETSSSSGSSTAVAATVSERKKDKIRANALIDDAIAANAKDTFNECTAVEPTNGKLFDVEFKPVKEIDKLKDAVEKLLGREILRQENETIDNNYLNKWKGKLKNDEILAKCAEVLCNAFNNKTPYTIAELLERVGETYDIKGDILHIAKSKYIYVGNNGFKYKDGRKSDLESLCDWVCKSAEEKHIKKKDQFGIQGGKSVENEIIIEL